MKNAKRLLIKLILPFLLLIVMALFVSFFGISNGNDLTTNISKGIAKAQASGNLCCREDKGDNCIAYGTLIVKDCDECGAFCNCNCKAN